MEGSRAKRDGVEGGIAKGGGLEAMEGGSCNGAARCCKISDRP